MPTRQLTGGRIRERRLALGLRQADLAERVGISASYLNLIEHSRRRIGGKLLLDLSALLGVEPSALTDGAEVALIGTLREAAVASEIPDWESDSIEDFAARFPGWAGVLAARHRQVLALERTVAHLSDRLTHDPYLATSLHEVLSSVTAIRATAAILVETREIEPEWRERFHRNINEDATRLARNAQALVGYLDGAGRTDDVLAAPQDELEQFLARHAHRFDALEDAVEGVDSLIAALVEDGAALRSASARAQARVYMTRYHADAQALPRDRLLAALRQAGRDAAPDPLRLAEALGVGPATVMRRLASLDADEGAGPVGLVSCDASGTLLLRRPIDGFPLPRFGAACPRWPLFTALSRPLTPIRQILRQSGPQGRLFSATAIAQPVGRADYNTDPLFEAHMMVVPLDHGGSAAADMSAHADPAREVGVSCRICPALQCDGRREPSILADGF